MSKYVLSREENISIINLVNEVFDQYQSAEDLEFLVQARLIAHDLPKGLKKFLLTFQLHEDTHGHCVISGYEINDKRIGKSPRHWKERMPCSPTSKEEIYFIKEKITKKSITLKTLQFSWISVATLEVIYGNLYSKKFIFFIYNTTK